MDIELLRNLLLGALILLLVVILYKRLLKFLQGKTNSALYSSFLMEGVSRVEGNLFRITVNIPAKEQVKLFIENPEGDQHLELLNGDTIPQDYTFDLDANDWVKGKYCCILLTKNQRSFRYFWVK